MSGRLSLESPDARSGRPERASRVRRQRRSVVAQGEARDAGLPTLPCNDAQKRGSGRRGAPAFNEWVQLCAAPTPIAMGRLRPDASVRPMRSPIRRTFHAADPFLRVARVRGAHPPREAAKSVRCTSAGHGSSLVGWSDLVRQWATAKFRERDRPSRFAHCESDAVRAPSCRDRALRRRRAYAPHALGRAAWRFCSSSQAGVGSCVAFGSALAALHASGGRAEQPTVGIWRCQSGRAVAGWRRSGGGGPAVA
jgi:hypothetical protein